MKKYTLILCMLLFIAFKTGDNKSQYPIPKGAWSLTSGDIDIDGDNDIIIGHNYSSQTEWSGVSIMLNDGNGYFELFDSVFLFGWQPDILLGKMNLGINKEIIAKHEDAQNENEYIAIINNFELTNISYFSLNTYEGVDNKIVGDINGDTYNDIVIASNSGQFWGVMYNDGTGAFSEPEYHYVSDYYPRDVACSDLNGDGRDDIAICGQSTNIYFSYPSGFDSLVLEAGSYKDQIEISDFDMDGYNDILSLVTFTYTTVLKTYKNIGNVTYDTLTFTIDHGSNSFSVTDFNNDSLPDLIFELYNWAMPNTEAFKIYLNKGDFQLDEPSIVYIELNGSEGPRHFHCADYDGNSYNDIAVTRSLEQRVLEILFNDGNGNFEQNPITQIPKTNAENPKSTLSCFPNPFEIETTFEIKIKEPYRAELLIFNLRGKLITTSIHNLQGSKINSIKWDGTNNKGKSCPPGTYIASFRINNEISTMVKIIKLN